MAQFGIGSNLSVPFLFFGSNGTGGENPNNGTVITNIYNFSGDVINGDVTNNFTVTGGTLVINQNTVIVGGGLVLTNNYDYHITNVNEITLYETINNENITIINNYGGGEIDINTILKGKFKNDIEARAGGVLNGQLYRVTADNDYGMSENFIKYLEPDTTAGIF